MLVSLPKEWIDANNLDKSSQVEIETNQNNLSILISQNKKPSKEVDILYPLTKEENIVANITGAYLLGYDVIRIIGSSTISVQDRESIRGSMRRLVGMEIVDEDASKITVQFLLDETSINPQKILKRMNSIALGMFTDTLLALQTNDKTNLQTIPHRDNEINRQYFLLVRLIRSTILDPRLATVFNLESIDILDYRIAANTLEITGDSIVELSKIISNATLSKSEITKILDFANQIEKIQTNSLNAFIENNRSLAISAIKLHRNFEQKITKTRLSLENKKQIQLVYIDLLYMLEKIGQLWSDISDLVPPNFEK